MAWTTPLTAVANATLTAAQWNASVRDNLLMTAPALASSVSGIFAVTGTNTIAQRIPDSTNVATLETTTSTSYTSTLSGGGGSAGPAMSGVSTGTKALIAFHCRQSTSVASTNVWTAVAISGASSIGASDAMAISYDLTGQIYHGLTYVENGLTAGSNTFTMNYRVSGGTGTFASRRINVVPF